MEFRGKLNNIKEITEDAKHFEFSVPADFSFKPGQFVMLKKEGIERAYSMASCPCEKGKLELYVKKVPGGKMTTKLFNMKKGSTIKFKGPYGNFTPKEDAKGMMFVGVGTSITPLRSMVHHLLHSSYTKKIRLITGARRIRDLAYYDEFTMLAAKYPNFSYHPMASNEFNYEIEKDRVQKILKRHISAEKNYNFYLCGLPAMVEETKEFLSNYGIDPKKVKFEAC